MTKSKVGDPRWPAEVQFPSLFQAVRHAAPKWSDERIIKLGIPEAERAMFGPDGKWVGPNGLTYRPVFHAREVANGSEDPQVVGYYAERPDEWLVRKPDGTVYAHSYTSKKAALTFVGAKKAKTVQPGWYRAADHDIYRRDMTPVVEGQNDGNEAEAEPEAGVPGVPA